MQIVNQIILPIFPKNFPHYAKSGRITLFKKKKLKFYHTNIQHFYVSLLYQWAHVSWEMKTLGKFPWISSQKANASEAQREMLINSSFGNR